jgi:hypothetical protein
MADPVLIQDNYRTDNSGKEAVHGVECVGRVSFYLEHPLLTALANANDADYGGVKNGVYLTGFKLEDVLIRSEGMLQNAKLIPLLNGDTMTLTNSNKSGILTIACTRTAAGISGGDLVSIGDFIRSQGDSSGGKLTVSWTRNGVPKKLVFKAICVQDCPPIQYAGNDLPSYGVKLTYATYHDDDYPTWS